jgi:alanyl-tRNA synthetase
MTDRLYYTNAYLRTFDAVVQRVQGDAITLDRTAFYPTSGGQPFDIGTIGGVRVIDVIDRDDGSITHVIGGTPDGSIPFAPGDLVHGEIDWPRRFDHMQQHTGQHVLSAAFDRVFGVRTVSFHLGAEVSTLDLARDMSSSEITTAENEANRIVWENRAVSIRFATAAEASALPLRKEPARAGTLRLVDITDFDLSACGGTHVAQTGAIGAIAVVSWERFKGGQRLEFLCGGRVLARLRAWRDAVAASTRLLSVLPAELPVAIERLQTEAKAQKRTLTSLQYELAAYRADELAATAELVSMNPHSDLACDQGVGPGVGTSRPSDMVHVRLVMRSIDADASGLKALASAIASKPGHIVVLVSSSRPALLVVARSDDVALSAQKMLATLIAMFGGRGGGKAELAQGGGLDAAPDQIMRAARASLMPLTS